MLKKKQFLLLQQNPAGKMSSISNSITYGAIDNIQIIILKKRLNTDVPSYTTNSPANINPSA